MLFSFNFRSVGMPSIRTVSIINPHSEQALQLQSISGSTVHFHASFFQSKVSDYFPIENLQCAPKLVTKVM